MSKQNSERIDEAVCLYKFTGVYHDYIYFDVKNITNNETTTAVIRTPWIINYSKKLEKSLEKIKVVDVAITVMKWDNDKEKEFKCDWIHKSKFREWFVNKGSVFITSNSNNEANNKLAVAFANTSLDDNYPMVEMLLTVFGSIILFILYVFIHVKCKKSSSDSRNFYSRTIV